MEVEVFHLGVQVYRWSTPDQILLLRDGLGPAAGEARSRGLCQRFWYTPFDARGPHVFALFTSAREVGAGDARERRAALESHLGGRLSGWLSAHPSAIVLERGELDRRHAACRGKALNAIDEQPGRPANDSLCSFEHPADRYPFALTADLTRSEALWRELDGMSFWAIEHLTEAGAAIRLVAAVDRTLSAVGAPTAAFWRYVAATWILPLRDRLEHDEEEVLAALPAMIGAKNSRIFEGLWDAGPTAGDPPIERGVRLVVEDPSLPIERRLRLLREIVHQALAQLLLGVQARLPLILYAWHRNLSVASAV